MISALFLSCALSLPLANFQGPENLDEWFRQYDSLKEFIHKVHPGASILITQIDQKPNDPAWFRLPFTWNDMAVWVRYHHIYDHKAEERRKEWGQSHLNTSS